MDLVVDKGNNISGWTHDMREVKGQFQFYCMFQNSNYNYVNKVI